MSANIKAYLDDAFIRARVHAIKHAEMQNLQHACIDLLTLATLNKTVNSRKWLQ